MKISIIGAGNIGATLARKLAAAGHHIRLANSRGPESIQPLASEAGATAVTREAAVQDAEVIILAIPFDKHPTRAEKGQPAGQADRLASPVAGDDPQAKAVAMSLVDMTGFDAVDAGSLSGSWRQQPGTPAYCTELSQTALIAALQAADREHALHNNRDALIKEFMSAGELTHEAIVVRNRAVNHTPSGLRSKRCRH